MAQRSFFESFARAFQTEVEAYNVQLVPALFGPRGNMPSVLPAGRQEVLDMIRRLGHRYRGCLLTNSLREVADIRSWMVDLIKLGQPVVWFDRLKENPRLSLVTPLFGRCHESEARAVRLALDHLVSLGHRHAAFPVFANESWSRRRREILLNTAGTEGCDIEIEATQDSDDVFGTGDRQTQVTMLGRWYRELDVVKTAVDALLDRSHESADVFGAAIRET
jgi:DNA-binding LacI/PurR family transcriptional regulator